MQNPNWTPPQKPAEFAESRLLNAILEGNFPIGSNLPAERDLATQLGITRPTLREALQRLSRDGWIEIRHGHSTRVRDYWREGNLAVLGAIARQSMNLPSDFVTNLLSVRLVIAPSYTRLAVEKAPEQIEELLLGYANLPDIPEAFVDSDWKLHHRLTVASGNPIFTLILNGFYDLYQAMGIVYFNLPHSRVNSRAFYSDLLVAVQSRNADAAEEVTRRVMRDSLQLWHAALYHQS